MGARLLRHCPSPSSGNPSSRGLVGQGLTKDLYIRVSEVSGRKVLTIGQQAFPLTLMSFGVQKLGGMFLLSRHMVHPQITSMEYWIVWLGVPDLWQCSAQLEGLAFAGSIIRLRYVCAVR